MKTRLELRLTQRLVMTPQLQQAIRLLQLSRLEISQVINQELMENPLLEDSLSDTEEENASSEAPELSSKEGEAGAEESTATEENTGELDLKWEGFLDDDGEEFGENTSSQLSADERPSFDQTLSRPTSLIDHLLWQLNLSAVGPSDRGVGQLIIGNIDDNGYLRASIAELAIAAKVPESKVERILELIQDFDPPGVAARDLKECLLLQLKPLALGGSLVEQMIRDHIQDLEKKRFQAIARALAVSLEEVHNAAKIIEQLEPKPGRPFADAQNLYIIPDISVVKSEDGYAVLLNDDGLPRLRINPYYRRLLRSRNEIAQGTRSYLEDRLRSAVWLVRSIEHRNRTVLKVAESIVKFQKDFFDRGIQCLRPLVLQQVAEDIGMHESTISRVTTNKYMYTPQGLFELKYFFNSSLLRASAQESGLSSVTVREMIRKMVGEEDSFRPLRDQEIVEALRARDIEIARRTVAKYRSELNIPSAGRRKRSY